MGIRRARLAALLLLVSACGGGGGSTPPPDPGTAVVAGRVLPAGSGLTATSAGGGLEGAVAAPGAIVPGSAVVWFEAGADAEPAIAAASAAAGRALRIARRITSTGPALVVGGPEEVAATRAWIRDLSLVPGVAAAEANFLRESAALPDDPATRAHPASFSMIRVEGAWRYTRGDPSVIVAVVDSGVGLAGSPHPDLADRLVAGLGAGESGIRDTAESGWHGTGVAGLVVATPDNGFGIAGVAPGVVVQPERIANLTGITSFDSAVAIRFAAGLEVPDAPTNPTPARVINMSYGSGTAAGVERQAAIAAYGAGVILVAAAGNGSGPVQYPAAWPEVIAVSSVGNDARLASYSNFGPPVEICAPGGDPDEPDGRIWTCTFSGDPPRPDTRGRAGTSFAAPQVSAVAALVLCANPDLGPDEVRDVLASTALDLGPAGRDDEYGYGLVDAQAAVERAVVLRGGDLLDRPAGLKPRTPTLLLTEAAPTVSLLVANSGSGTATIDSATAPEGIEVVVERADADASGDAIVRATASFPPGVEPLRRGAIELSGTGGTVEVPLLAISAAVPDLGEVTVTLTDAATGEVVATTTTGLGAAYEFSFGGVPAGRYLLGAVADRDGDLAADRADEWGGAWPAADRQVLVVASGEVRTGLGVPVAPVAESIRTGTAGGPVEGVLGVLVRDAASGLPLAGARVVLGDGAREAETDERGIALFGDVSGPQTVTATAEGHGAESWIDVDAATIGFALPPTAPGADAAAVPVVVVGAGAGAGTTTRVFAGMTERPDGTVAAPGTVSAIVVDDATGEAVAVGHADVTAEELAAAPAAIELAVTPLDGSRELLASSGFAGAWSAIAVLPGASAADSRVLGLAGRAGPGEVRVPLAASAAPDAELLVILSGEDAAGGRSYALAGALFAPPRGVSPAAGVTIREGDAFGIETVGGETFVALVLARAEDGFVWTLRAAPGTTSIALPRAGALSAGDFEWRVETARLPLAAFPDLAGLPLAPASAPTAFESFAASASRSARAD